MNRRLAIPTVLVALLRCGPAPALPAAPQGPPSAVKSEPRQANPPTTSPYVRSPAPLPGGTDALLDRLERSAESLRDFSARIVYRKWDALTMRWEIRSGEVLYQVDPVSGSKRFAVLFDTLIVGNRKEDRLKHYVFDGRWLVEIDHAHKQFIKRQIVAPGRMFDPLKLGQGPFPLPVGQPKQEVLARFEVEPAEVPAEGPLSRLTNVDGLRLVPKPGTREAEDFLSVLLFYDRTTLLPVGIETLGSVLLDADDPQSRARTIVLLSGVKRNAGVDEEKLDILEPDPTQWRIDVRPWRER